MGACLLCCPCCHVHFISNCVVGVRPLIMFSLQHGFITRFSESKKDKENKFIKMNKTTKLPPCFYLFCFLFDKLTYIIKQLILLAVGPLRGREVRLLKIVINFSASLRLSVFHELIKYI